MSERARARARLYARKTYLLAAAALVSLFFMFLLRALRLRLARMHEATETDAT